METPRHPQPPGAGRGETGSGGYRRCPYRAAGTKVGTSHGVSIRCGGMGAPGSCLMGKRGVCVCGGVS